VKEEQGVGRGKWKGERGRGVKKRSRREVGGGGLDKKRLEARGGKGGTGRMRGGCGSVGGEFKKGKREKGSGDED